MLETTWRVLLFALIAGMSPIAIVSTLAVLTSRRGRTNGLVFAGGFILAQTAVFLAAFFVGSDKRGISICIDLSERRRAEGERDAARALFDRFVDASPVGFALFDRSLRCVRANRAVTVEALAQLGVLDADVLERLNETHRPPTRDPRGVEIAYTTSVFQLAPLSELG